MKILLVVIYRRGYFNKVSSSFSSTFKQMGSIKWNQQFCKFMILQKVILEMGSVMGSDVHLSTPTTHWTPNLSKVLLSLVYFKKFHFKFHLVLDSQRIQSRFSPTFGQLVSLRFKMKHPHLPSRKSFIFVLQEQGSFVETVRLCEESVGVTHRR